MSERKLMLGNEAMALGLLENGCAMATSYPGTPASEILTSVAALKRTHGLSLHVQWAVNEKIAFEIAYAAAITGLRTAVSMKQVGLNVASDPLMSAAYMGTKGGFIIISADDPGPHSSQTEQDSRLMAVMAKIPVLDPDSPEQARRMTALGYELSEAFEIPVMIRPDHPGLPQPAGYARRPRSRASGVPQILKEIRPGGPLRQSSDTSSTGSSRRSWMPWPGMGRRRPHG